MRDVEVEGVFDGQSVRGGVDGGDDVEVIGGLGGVEEGGEEGGGGGRESGAHEADVEREWEGEGEDRGERVGERRGGVREGVAESGGEREVRVVGGLAVVAGLMGEEGV